MTTNITDKIHYFSPFRVVNDSDLEDSDEEEVNRWDVETSTFTPTPVDQDLLKCSTIYTGANPSR